jgi:hypothetical protein
MQTIQISSSNSYQVLSSGCSYNSEVELRSKIISAKKLPPSLDMNVVSSADKNRASVEAFIQQGFAKTYQAKVSITMPWLLAVSEGNFKAAIGIRSAKEPLFIEQYLAKPIEDVIPSKTNTINRNEIAEIGHLYSNATRFTLPLLLVTAVSLFCNDYKYMVFSGTEHVIKLIEKTGVKCSFIAEADENALSHSEDDWGTYYKTNPKVVSILLSDVMTLIDSNKRYSSMFDSLNDKIAKTTANLRLT